METCPWADLESFGYGQPNVRKAAWSLIQIIVLKYKGGILVRWTMKELKIIYRFVTTYSSKFSNGYPPIGLGRARHDGASSYVAASTYVSQASVCSIPTLDVF